jgi:hypothetical protein
MLKKSFISIALLYLSLSSCSLQSYSTSPVPASPGDTKVSLEATVKKLQDFKAADDAKKPKPVDETLLFVAIRHKDVEALKTLLTSQLKLQNENKTYKDLINTPNPSYPKNTPLHAAAIMGKKTDDAGIALEITTILLENGANPFSNNSNNQRPSVLAMGAVKDALLAAEKNVIDKRTITPKVYDWNTLLL